MANDGGLQKVFQSAELVYNQLLVLHNNKLHDKTPAIPIATSAAVATSSCSKINLSQHSSAALRRTVTPLVHSMEQLDAAALLSLNPTQDGNGAVLGHHQGLSFSVTPIHDRIIPYRRNHHHDNTVRYLHCREVADKYSVGIFVFPPGASIPLHDHPSMVVVSRVLYGELKVKSYSVVSTATVHDGDCDGQMMDMDEEEEEDDEAKRRNDGTNSDSPSRFRSSINRIKDFVSRAVLSSSHHHDYHAATTQKLQVQENKSPLGVQFSSAEAEDGESSIIPILSAPNVTALYPEEGNCHSFVAGPNGAAVLDVLLPPYAEDDSRDCTFYEAVENEHGYCLTPIDQPSDFNCLSGEYGRFTSCE